MSNKPHYKVKHYFRLNVMDDLFYVGQWDHYPSDEEITNVFIERFKGPMLNGVVITFKVEKIQYLEG